MGVLRKGEKASSSQAPSLVQLDPRFTKERLEAMYSSLGRSIYDSNRKCPWCSKEINIAGNYCRECNRPAPRPICPRCHSPLYSGAKTCWGCKWKIEPAEAMRAALEVAMHQTLALKKAAAGKRLPGR
jgi:predicted amidophosphoribosyltransferase